MLSRPIMQELCNQSISTFELFEILLAIFCCALFDAIVALFPDKIKIWIQLFLQKILFLEEAFKILDLL